MNCEVYLLDSLDLHIRKTHVFPIFGATIPVISDILGNCLIYLNKTIITRSPASAHGSFHFSWLCLLNA